MEPISIGAFVFEYHVEIYTNAKMICRFLAKTTTSYILMLNADQKAEVTTSNSKALCLEGEHYSNVAWFLNHRCKDANLVDMLVTIDEVDAHYYHVAFLAKRKINPYKDLTWVWHMSFSFQVLTS